MCTSGSGSCSTEAMLFLQTRTNFHRPQRGFSTEVPTMQVMPTPPFQTMPFKNEVPMLQKEHVENIVCRFHSQFFFIHSYFSSSIAQMSNRQPVQLYLNPNIMSQSSCECTKGLKHNQIDHCFPLHPSTQLSTITNGLTWRGTTKRNRGAFQCGGHAASHTSVCKNV